MNKIIEEEILEIIQRCIKILKDKIVEESTEIILEMKVIAEVEIGKALEKNHFLETLAMIETIGIQAIVGPDQDQGPAQIETQSDVTSVKYCPTSREERELEQLQQKLNLDGEQTSLKSLATNTHDNLNKISSEEDQRLGHLNL